MAVVGLGFHFYRKGTQMAKKKAKAEGISKSAAIREAMAAGAKDVKAVQEAVKEKHGLDLAYQLTYQVMNKGKKPKAKKKAASNGATNIYGSFGAGVKFVQAAGGLDNAKAILGAIEQVRGM
jgi:hypothetical protein